MDDFKIKSIDEFDNDFVEANKPASEPAPQAAPEKPAINFFDDEDVKAAPEAPAAPATPSSVYTAAPVTPNPYLSAPETAQKPAAPVSLYKTESMKDNGVSPFVYEPQSYDEDDEDENYYKEKKNTVLPTIAKIFSMVMLVVTLVVFMLGCFVTMFLNSKNNSVGGICFATVIDEGQNYADVKADSLILCKKVDIEEYNISAGKEAPIVAVESDKEGEEGAKLYTVIGVDSANKILTLERDGVESEQSIDNIYGNATFSFGSLGKVILFASSHAVLVLILFILLAALWVLIILMIDRAQAKEAALYADDEENPAK